MRDLELFYDGEGGVGYGDPEIEKEEIPEDEEFQEEEEIEEDDGWMQGWYPSRNKPENLCGGPDDSKAAAAHCDR
jgi:hypothetical protein